MKRLAIIFIVALSMFDITTRAQGIEGGLKAGLITSKISTHVDDYTPQTVNGYQFGAFARINLGPFYLQPEAYYNSKGGEYIDKISPSTVNSFNLNSVDVPALVGLKIINNEVLNLRVMGGPVVSFLTDKSVKGQFTEANLENSLFSWQYGAGIDFMFLSLDVRKVTYGKNFTPDFDTKNGTFVISLGLKLF
jgi:hypothetical protein